jgi:hypothetical protein
MTFSSSCCQVDGNKKQQSRKKSAQKKSAILIQNLAPPKTITKQGKLFSISISIQYKTKINPQYPQINILLL